jgi:hypothetical protein
MSNVAKAIIGEADTLRWTGKTPDDAPEESREVQIAKEILKAASGLAASPVKDDIVQLATELKQMHAAPTKE